jgi:dTDP-4-amino-4,6-dideoxygalactose transaminase
MGERLAIEGGKPVRETFLIFGSPQISEVEIREVVDTLRSGWIGTGPKTHRFERMFAEYVRSRHAVAVNSCTAGLELALDVLGIGPGDEVITTPLTFSATANVIARRGARPVFADIELPSMNIDPDEIERRITLRTRAIIPVHFAGRPCRMEEILDIARRHDLYVIEDAAHAIEAWYRDKKVGSIGDITAFSFYVTKNVVTGEGGMVTTDREDWAEEIRIKSLHGISKDAWKRYTESGFQPYDTLYPGYKFNMTDIQASLGIHQLARVEENLKIRERHWMRYNQAFADIPEITVPEEEEGIRHARHLYTVLLDVDALKVDRNRFAEILKAENIGSGIHFIALHLHSFYRKRFGYKRGDFPKAEYVSDRTLSLPLSPKLSDEDVEDVIRAVRKITENVRR